jgi:hypothetical protein
MRDDSWLWQSLRDLFQVDDGSLPEIRVNFVDSQATANGYELLRTRANSVVTQKPYFWSKARNAEVPLDSVPNPAALVVSGESEPFHVVLGGIDSNGAVMPDLGVFVFPDQLALDYQMGPQWNPSNVHALFRLLTELVALDSRATISLEENVVSEVEGRFRDAWRRWSAEHAA